METLLYQRIKTLCSEYNITINRLESELNFAPSTIQKWKSVNSPSISKVVEVANYFNVSIDYLLGRTEIKGSADDVLNNAEIISLQRAKENIFFLLLFTIIRLLRKPTPSVAGLLSRRCQTSGSCSAQLGPRHLSAGYRCRR